MVAQGFAHIGLSSLAVNTFFSSFGVVDLPQSTSLWKVEFATVFRTLPFMDEGLFYAWREWHLAFPFVFSCGQMDRGRFVSLSGS